MFMRIRALDKTTSGIFIALLVMNLAVLINFPWVAIVILPVIAFLPGFLSVSLLTSLEELNSLILCYSLGLSLVWALGISLVLNLFSPHFLKLNTPDFL